MGAFLLWLVFLIPSYLYSGFVFSRLWAWFIVPIFSLPQLTVMQAVGVNVVVAFLTATYPKNEFKLKDGQLVEVSGLDAVIKQIGWAFLYQSLIWGIGYGWHRWMQ